jgi:aspartyl-tRNA(Asn)/glutamyl-tRNA(Gln) amidotransferase subunit C
MSISIKDVEKIAELARLNLTPEEKNKFTKQFNIILEYFNKLNELDTSRIEPLSHTLDISNIFREDQVQPSLPVEKVLENAPDKTGNYFKVPKVIEK